jgi:branched-chain amino acid aminotransferase
MYFFFDSFICLELDIKNIIYLTKAKKLSVIRTTEPKTRLPNKDLVFGKTFSDHMLEVEFDSGKGGWGKPLVSPYHKLELDPAASVFHYALEV